MCKWEYPFCANGTSLVVYTCYFSEDVVLAVVPHPYVPHVLGLFDTDEEYRRQKRRNLVDKQSRKSNVQGVTDYSRHHSEQRYIGERQQRQRKKTTKIAVIAIIAVVVCGIIVGALAYASSLNSRITTKDENLLSSLKANSPDEPFYMLLLGVDKGEERLEDEEYGRDDSNYRADTIMLCRIDPKNTKATIVSVHRDLLVTMPDGSEGKINSIFSLEGASGMVKTVSKLAGVDISHYAEIDFDSFMGIVDAIGGVEVTIPVDVSDPEYTKLELKAGTHTLNGHDALMLCRTRHAYDDYGDGDLYRAANQRSVIASIVKKVLKSDPATMVSAISSMAESVKTDMDLNQILGLAAQMRDFDTEKDLYAGMTPTETEVIDDIYYERLDEAAWKKMMNRVNQGMPPTENTDTDLTAGVAGKASDKKDEKTGEKTDKDSSSSSTDKKDSDSNSSEKSEKKDESADEKKDDSSSKTSSSKDLKSVNKNSEISVIGTPGGSATVIASDLGEQGFTAYAYENASFVADSNVVVYGDSSHKADAEALASYLGSDYTAVQNDGSYYLASDIVVWVVG